jgi:UDP-GlcNAc:undecaprenyl-phosphate GlcNAc-1-phosphate transferase
MLNTVLTISTAFLLSLFLTPLLAHIAKRLRIYDMPGGRKQHEAPTPLLGGIAISAAAITASALFGGTPLPYAKPVLLVATAVITFMGLIDDIIRLSAKRRIVILFLVALTVFFGSIKFYFTEPGITMLDDGFVRIAFSVYIIFWIVAITNAVNFSDGLDGLASYLSLISCAAFALIFCLQGRETLVLTITLALAGAIAGFIPYNRSPASVFMGDAGSMFIGFMLSLLSITSIAYENTLLAVVVPIYILFVPILDMCLSVLRRYLGNKSVMQPDSAHFHHRLNAYFHNHLTVVIILSLVQAAFAAAGIFIYTERLYIEGWILLGALLAASAAYTAISSRRRRAAGDRRE